MISQAEVQILNLELETSIFLVRNFITSEPSSHKEQRDDHKRGHGPKIYVPAIMLSSEEMELLRIKSQHWI